MADAPDGAVATGRNAMHNIGLKSCLGFVLGLATTLTGADMALGADLDRSPPVREDRPLPTTLPWTVSVTPYGWLPFLHGDVTVKGRTAGIDVNPIEVLGHLERVPWMSYVEARRGPLAFYNDVFYAKLGVTASGINSRSVRPEIGGTLGASLGATFEETVVEIGAAYEIARWSGGGAGAKSTAIDVLAGGRYWRQSLDVNFALAGTLNIGGLVLSGDRAIARSGTVDWIDPLIGFRVRHQLAPGQELMLRGDIGGFDVGSNFSWNLLGAYSWQFAIRDGVTYSGLLGYRALSVDYATGSGVNRYEFNVIQHGPMVGLTISF